LSDSNLPKAILQKLFWLDCTLFGLFKAIFKTSGIHARLNSGELPGGMKQGKGPTNSLPTTLNSMPPS
jgi:hypothetical protein